ncbi:MAG: ABC transporter ATP-binding protein [Ktedonobacteraceae bacterium]|nr:ABC transporter ATP-binding protein [Ktedonobacteraceae bacterium]
MTHFAIDARNLSLSFGSIQAINDLSLSINRGTVFGFLGANGAGKTTTIHMLLGLLEPATGQASVLGFDVRTQAEHIRSCTGALLESHGLYERMNAEENLEFYGRIAHMPRTERAARIKELLIHVDLWERRHEQVGKWSRGMKQKLALLRALMHRPMLVFLDEPTAGLDPASAVTLNKDLVSLARQEGMTVFLNTHNLADAEKYCDQVGIIRKGRLLAVGNPNELRDKISGIQVDVIGHGFDDHLLTLLRQQPEIAEAQRQTNGLQIKLVGEREVAPLIRLIVQAGGNIEEVRRNRGSLEDMFITLMEEA